jgi:hypothetical protein
MQLLASYAGDCFKAFAIVRSIVGHKTLDSIAGVRAAVEKWWHHPTITTRVAFVRILMAATVRKSRSLLPANLVAGLNSQPVYAAARRPASAPKKAEPRGAVKRPGF